MTGQWVERPDRSWFWDTTAPAADPSATHILSAYPGRAPMSRDEPAVPRTVYDPRLGVDGGARYADPDPIPAIDPDRPVEHVDQLGPEHDGPAYWVGSDPQQIGLDDYERDLGATPSTWATPSADLVCCPTCGTGVNPDRLRG